MYFLNRFHMPFCVQTVQVLFSSWTWSHVQCESLTSLKNEFFLLSVLEKVAKKGAIVKFYDLASICAHRGSLSEWNWLQWQKPCRETVGGGAQRPKVIIKLCPRVGRRSSLCCLYSFFLFCTRVRAVIAIDWPVRTNNRNTADVFGECVDNLVLFYTVGVLTRTSQESVMARRYSLTVGIARRGGAGEHLCVLPPVDLYTEFQTCAVGIEGFLFTAHGNVFSFVLFSYTVL